VESLAAQIQAIQDKLEESGQTEKQEKTKLTEGLKLEVGNIV